MIKYAAFASVKPVTLSVFVFSFPVVVVGFGVVVGSFPVVVVGFGAVVGSFPVVFVSLSLSHIDFSDKSMCFANLFTVLFSFRYRLISLAFPYR